jgi:hypothetical protein
MQGDQGDIRLGGATRETACRVLEQQLGAVWAAVLESHGYDPAAGFRVVLSGLALEPLESAPPTTADGALPLDGRQRELAGRPLRQDAQGA